MVAHSLGKGEVAGPIPAMGTSLSAEHGAEPWQRASDTVRLSSSGTAAEAAFPALHVAVAVAQHNRVKPQAIGALGLQPQLLERAPKVRIIKCLVTVVFAVAQKRAEHRAGQRLAGLGPGAVVRSGCRHPQAILDESPHRIGRRPVRLLGLQAAGHFGETALALQALQPLQRPVEDPRQFALQRGRQVGAIDEYVRHHNTNPKPFIWTKSARDILQKVIRANSKISSKQNETLH